MLNMSQISTPEKNPQQLATQHRIYQHENGAFISPLRMLIEDEPSAANLLQDQSQAFVFPERLTPGRLFKNVQEVLECMHQEATDRKLPVSVREYVVRTMGPSHYIKLRCEHCRQFVTLVPREGQLMVSVNYKIHLHSRDPPAKPSFKIPNKQTDMPGALHSSQSLPSEEEPPSSEQQKEQPTIEKLAVHQRQQGCLQNHFQKHNYSAELEWPVESQYPTFLVAVSPEMIRTFARFGDLVSFDVVASLRKKNLGKRPAQTAMFTVNDNNARLLIAGFAVCSTFSASTLARVLRVFFELHGRIPLTLLTGPNPAIADAIEILKKEGILLNHIINPLLTLNKLLRKKFPPSEVFVEKLKSAMTTRSLHTFQEVVSEIQQTTQGAYLANIMRENGTVFYCQCGTAYLGLRRDNSEQLGELLDFYFANRCKLPTFVRKITAIEDKLRTKALNHPEMCSDPVEEIYCDERLKTVKLQLQCEPFSRFMENYLNAVHNFALLEDRPDTKVVSSLLTGQRFAVEHWRCECQEVERTGIPCPHLLTTAMISSKSFIELVNPRWIIPTDNK